jgi:hypothetical protein
VRSNFCEALHYLRNVEIRAASLNTAFTLLS